MLAATVSVTIGSASPVQPAVCSGGATGAAVVVSIAGAGPLDGASIISLASGGLAGGGLVEDALARASGALAARKAVHVWSCAAAPAPGSGSLLPLQLLF